MANDGSDIVAVFDNLYDELIAAEDHPATPAADDMLVNYPNPFNPATTLSFTVPLSSHVEIAVFRCIGEGGKHSSGKGYEEWEV